MRRVEQMLLNPSKRGSGRPRKRSIKKLSKGTFWLMEYLKNGLFIECIGVL